MNKNTYRSAFSSVRPSREAVEHLLAIPEEQPKRRRTVRWTTLIAAAVLTALLLSGTVFAASRGWFRMKPSPEITEHSLKEVDGPTQPANPPKPQTGIELENPGQGNYVGFTVNGFSIPGANTLGCLSVEAWLDYRNLLEDYALTDASKNTYLRYVAETSDGEVLCAEVLDRTGLGYRSYFTRYETEVVKEGTLSGLETVWLRIEEPDGGDTWHLFCREETLGCTLVVSSNRDFARCEALLTHLTLVDTGVPIRRTDTKTVFGVGRVELPEGLRYWQNAPLSTELLNASLADPTQDLSGLWRQQSLSRPDGSSIEIFVYAERLNISRQESASLEKTGTINGQEACWYHDVNYLDTTLTLRGRSFRSVSGSSVPEMSSSPPKK